MADEITDLLGLVKASDSDIVGKFGQDLENNFQKIDDAYATTIIELESKADKDADATENNIAKFDTNKNPVDSTIAANSVSDAIGKKHIQNTDQYLDYGGDNQVAVADVKAAVTNSHKIYISTSDPSGGSDGEVWFKYTA